MVHTNNSDRSSGIQVTGPAAGPSPSENGATAQPPELAREPRILDRMVSELERDGLVGEQRAAKLIYLVLTSNLLDRPICAVVKGPSSTGKSFVTERVLSLFPASAFYRLSGMSERALAYGKEPLEHRTLVIEEAAALTGGMGAHLLRSLISEGFLRYETVERGKDGELQPKVIERPGPTGLLVTTTAINLDAELETRLFSIPITDSAEQTRSVMQAMAAQAVGTGKGASLDVRRWHELQNWLGKIDEFRVVIPYARTLAKAIPPVAVRLRRDFGALLGLIKTHAILHQYQRDGDAEGRIMATVEDYAVVHELVADLVSAGVEASVPPTVRETVEAVKELNKLPSWRFVGVPQSEVKKHLGLDKSTISRRIKHAIDLGYLVDEQEKKGQPAKLAVGEPMPDEVEVLPRPDALSRQCCTVAPFPEGEGVSERSPTNASAGSTEDGAFLDAAE